MSPVVTVVIADDQPLVRRGLGMLLAAQPDIVVAGEAADGREAVELSRSLRPDVVLMDLRMPGLDGIEATRLIIGDRGGGDQPPRVLALTTFSDDVSVYAALRAGASGFLLKHATPEDLASAVRVVASGRSYLDPEVTGLLIRALTDSPEDQLTPSGELVDRLTAREQEVFRLVALGWSNAEISAKFVLSEATVKTHVSRILMKTGSRDRAQAVALAYRSGAVPSR